MLEAQYFQEIEWKQNDHQKEAACCSFGESYQGLYELFQQGHAMVRPWSVVCFCEVSSYRSEGDDTRK